MADVTVILTCYRRPELLHEQVEAIRNQSESVLAIWAWANEPDSAMFAAVERANLDRLVVCSHNAYVHARFALAMTAPTEFVALFDDDTLPGPRWLENCLGTFRRTPGILGSAGVRLHDDGYRRRSIHGWHDPTAETVEVDLVGHAWFLKTEWVHYLFAAAAVTGSNGEDIELSARAWRLAGIRTYCPPHPPGDRGLWGSLRGELLGDDAVALSRRPSHLEERDRIVRAEIAAGWKPCHRRQAASPSAATGHRGGSNRGDATDGRTERPSDAAGSARPQDTVCGELDLHEDACLNWGRLYATGRRVLVIGHAVNHLAALLKTCRPERLVMVELDGSTREEAGRQPGEVLEADVEAEGPEFAEGSFDGIVCNDLLEQVRCPGRLLRRLRGWLAPGGRLLAAVANVRRLEVVEGLLTGRWTAARGSGNRRQVRFYTRREVEKLLFRAGFAADAPGILPGAGHREWTRDGRPGSVRVGRLHIGGLVPEEAEEFFARGFLIDAAPAPVSDHGTTSIVIVTHNELAYTRQCVESIRRLTDEPYELIFVDNASTDGTAEYLQSLPGARVIVNGENRGFPAAVNQAIEVARGDPVLLLNNDTIVTTGWLRRMLDALHREPAIGMVGPCSNFVSGEQQVPVRYNDIAGLDGFAWEWAKANDRALEETERLIGFCLLIRRAVIEQIGTLDERFGIGCFEDDDYCRRAILAGWRTVIARDAFVHHFGGRTFVGSGADFAAIMRENGKRFRDKWAAEALRPASLPEGAAPEELSPERPGPFTVVMAPGGGLLLQRRDVRLSLCMIVRDSARTLAACLETIRPWVDEMVIVDTGSTDETPRIVESFGGRLFHFPWCDDFSAARNESLRHARGEWLFWMDSDDTITEDCGRQLRALAYGDAAESLLGYVVQVHCPGWGEGGAQDVTAVDHVKLFRNRADLRFEGRIHEQILAAIRRAGGDVAWTDLYVVHSGSDPRPEAQERKRERDLRILHLELKERPEHTFTLFNLGMTYADASRYEEAADFLGRSIARSHPQDSHLRKAYALLVFAQIQMGRREDATATCRRGRHLFPDDGELRFRQGVLLHDLGCLEEAARAYRDVLENREQRHFSSVDRGIFGFKARQNLAVVYTDLGDTVAAEEQWRLVVQAVPRYRAGWRGLGDALMRGAKHAEASALAGRLMQDEDLRSEALLLRSRVAAARGDVAAARASLEAILDEAPGDLEVRRNLCQLLFDHGAADEAERALQELARLDPTDASALHNLGTIYLRTRRYREAVHACRGSLRLRPESAATHLHLGYALKEAGEGREAVAEFKEALRIDANSQAAREELARLERPSSRLVTPGMPPRS